MNLDEIICKVDNLIWRQVRNKVNSQVYNQVRYRNHNKTDYIVSGQIRNNIRYKIFLEFPIKLKRKLENEFR